MNSHVRKVKNGVFEFERRLPMKISDEKFVDRDFQSIEFDFNTQKAAWFAAYESGHNGDHYGSQRGEIPWNDALSSIETVSIWVKEKISRVLEEERKKNHQNVIDVKFNKMFDTNKSK
jgi:hypothetical protein